MTSPRARALGAVAAATLIAGLAAIPVIADEGAPEGARAADDGTGALVADGEAVGILPPAAGGPAMLRMTTYADSTVITPLTPGGQPETPVEVGAQPPSSADGMTVLEAHGNSAADVEPTPDYCRDPDHGRPTQPAPGKVAVTVSTLDREGAPAGGSFTMMDYHCEPYEANGYITFGVTPGEGRTFYLPPGTYSLMGQITTLDASGTLPDQVTFGGDPEFEVVEGEPLDLVVDARDGEPLHLDIPQESVQSLVVLGWSRGIEGNPPLLESTVIYPQSTSLTEISVIPSEPVTDGTSEFFPWIRATEPWASATLLGRGGPLDLDPTLVNPLQATAFVTTVRPPTLRAAIEDVGAGEAVLLTDGPDLAEQIGVAEAAGAVAVLVRPAGEGLTHPSVAASIPVLALTADEGRDVADRLAGQRGSAPLRLSVDPYADYTYDLVASLPAVDPDPYPDLSEEDLTTVEQTFHTDGTSSLTLEARAPSSDPCTCLLTPIFDMVEPGSTRVDHVIDNGSRWQQTVIDDYRLQGRTGPQTYGPDTAPENHWFGGSIGAGLKTGFDISHNLAPATTANGQVKLRLGPTDGAGHDLSGSFSRSGSVTRDGEVVADTFTGSATLDAPQEPSSWRVELATTHSADLWTHSSTVTSVWEFTAGTNPGETPEALPVLDATTRFPVDASTTRTRPGTLSIQPWRPDGADPSATVAVELSRDGGATWSALRGTMVDGTWTGRPQAASGPVDVRLTVSDDTGSVLTRTIEDAWTD